MSYNEKCSPCTTGPQPNIIQCPSYETGSQSRAAGSQFGADGSQFAPSQFATSSGQYGGGTYYPGNISMNATGGKSFHADSSTYGECADDCSRVGGQYGGGSQFGVGTNQMGMIGNQYGLGSSPMRSIGSHQYELASSQVGAVGNQYGLSRQIGTAGNQYPSTTNEFPDACGTTEPNYIPAVPYNTPVGFIPNIQTGQNVQAGLAAANFLLSSQFAPTTSSQYRPSCPGICNPPPFADQQLQYGLGQNVPTGSQLCTSFGAGGSQIGSCPCTGGPPLSYGSQQESTPLLDPLRNEVSGGSGKLDSMEEDFSLIPPLSTSPAEMSSKDKRESLMEWFDRSVEKELKKHKEFSMDTVLAGMPSSPGGDEVEIPDLNISKGVLQKITEANASQIEIVFDLRKEPDTELTTAVDKFVKAEAMCAFADAVKAAEAAADQVPPELVEEAALSSAKNYQTDVKTTSVHGEIEGVRPIEVVGYVGVTKPKYPMKNK